jgi:DNA-binding IclR family transcriptional regulator
MSKQRAAAAHRSAVPKNAKQAASSRRGKPVRNRYKAPALEKGLEIMEIVSAASDPIKTEEIARAAGRSRSEIYRMLQVLENHGYIAQGQNGEGYVATNQLFTLGMRKVPIGNLNSAALPEMRRLSDALGQSVWLVVPADDEIVFIAGIESRHSFCLSVNLGYHRPIVLANSGRLLYAFQPPEVQRSWLAQLRETAPPGADFDSFLADADEARRDGWLIRPSVAVEGVTDVCAPIWTATNIGCSANLIVPLVRVFGQNHSQEDVAIATRAAADRITQALRPHIVSG